jgi:hypothetical protein
MDARDDGERLGQSGWIYDDGGVASHTPGLAERDGGRPMAYEG